MNRSLSGFLIFLLVLAGAVTMVVWWAGPATISLALDDERRRSPYYLVHLITREDNADYFRRFGEQLREEEAQLLWRGGLKALHAGRVADEYQDVAIVEFAAGGDVLQMLTSSGYRQLVADSEPLLLGSATAPGPIARDETLMLWLLEVADNVEPAALDSLINSTTGYQGQAVWSTRADPLRGDAMWNHVLLIAFPTADLARGWLADPETATVRSLSRRHFLSDALLELRSG